MAGSAVTTTVWSSPPRNTPAASTGNNSRAAPLAAASGPALGGAPNRDILGEVVQRDRAANPARLALRDRPREFPPPHSALRPDPHLGLDRFGGRGAAQQLRQRLR